MSMSYNEPFSRFDATINIHASHRLEPPLATSIKSERNLVLLPFSTYPAALLIRLVTPDIMLFLHQRRAPEQGVVASTTKRMR